MKKSIIFASVLFATLNAFAGQMECKSEGHQYKLDIKANIEESVVHIDGKEQLTSSVVSENGKLTLTVIDLELASASILSISEGDLNNDQAAMSVELLGAPGSAATLDNAVCARQ